MEKLKEEIIITCTKIVAAKNSVLHEVFNTHQNALLNENKSSAGDKHETGRAMVQLEMEKAAQQIAVIEKMDKTLGKIKVQLPSSVIKLGSLVKTNLGYYFLAISLGQVDIKNQIVYVVSLVSPIGAQLIGKKVGETIEFNNRKIIIEKIV